MVLYSRSLRLFIHDCAIMANLLKYKSTRNIFKSSVVPDLKEVSREPNVKMCSGVLSSWLQPGAAIRLHISSRVTPSQQQAIRFLSRATTSKTFSTQKLTKVLSLTCKIYTRAPATASRALISWKYYKEFICMRSSSSTNENMETNLVLRKKIKIFRGPTWLVTLVSLSAQYVAHWPARDS